ncbi:MAG: hypothetical protein JWN86_1817 [Planctomycetota bacterium]|nr:hypothetical protein [Planctomycetota bacterium]
MTDLAILPSCHGCGLCCEHVGTPPGFSGGFVPDGTVSGLMWEDDRPIFLAMPEALRRELAAYYAVLGDPGVVDRGEAGLPCL